MHNIDFNLRHTCRLGHTSVGTRRLLLYPREYAVYRIVWFDTGDELQYYYNTIIIMTTILQ